MGLYLGSFGTLNLLFDAWTAGGLFYLFRVWRSRNAGDKTKAKTWHIVLALALIFGRTTGFWWSFLLALIPSSGWFFIFWPFKFIVLPPVVLMIGGFFELLSLYFAFTVFLFACVFLPIKIFEATVKISNAVSIGEMARSQLLGIFIKFWYWFTGRDLPQVETPPDDTQGARFAAKNEIVNCFVEVRDKKTIIEKQNITYYGQIEGKTEKVPLPLPNDKHTLLMASTRSGKGVSVIIPHLLRYQGSAFVLDPKGENARATGRHRAVLNNKVYYLDPFGISGKPKARFNPFSRFTPENAEAESKALSAALVMGERGKRDHWTASGQQLIAALILYVYSSPDFPTEEKDLPTVRRLLLGAVNETLSAMAICDLADGLLADLGASFMNTPEEERGSIISTAQRETEILDNPHLIRCLSASGEGEEVHFSQWHKNTMTVYLCLSAPKFPVFNRWLRLVLTAALNEMTDELNPPPLPACFMLDELATLGHLAAVENAVGLAAGYGVHLFLIFQDVAQMKDLYKGRWSSFIGNAGVRALFNLDDYDTAKYWSNFIGGHLVETTNQQQNQYGLIQGESKGKTLRPLLSPDEIMLYFAGKSMGESSKMLVLAQGKRPIITQRVPYYEDPRLSGLWDDPRYKQSINTDIEKDEDEKG